MGNHDFQKLDKWEDTDQTGARTLHNLLHSRRAR